MEKTNLNRLMRVLVPFVIMFIVQRLAFFALGMTSLSPTVCDLVSFTVASFVGIFFFWMGCGRGSLGLAPDKYTEAEDSETSVFPAADNALGRALYAVLSFAALVVVMFLITAMSDTQAFEAPEKSAVDFISLIVVHPLLEEYIFRWLFYRELRPMHPIFAGLAQAVMFALVHNTVGGMLYALASGVVIVAALEKSGSLKTAAAAHMLVNLRSFVYLTWLSDSALANAANVRTVIDFCIISVGVAAALVLMIRHGLKENGLEETPDDSGEHEDKHESV